MTVGGDYIHGDGEQVVSDAFELVVAMYIAYREAAGLVELDGFPESREYSRTITVRDWMCGSETDVPRDGM